MFEVSPCRSAAPLLLSESNTLRAKRCETSWLTTETTFWHCVSKVKHLHLCLRPSFTAIWISDDLYVLIISHLHHNMVAVASTGLHGLASPETS